MNKQESECADITKSTSKKYEKKTCCGIYGLRNKINNKWYVGESITSIQDRWDSYKGLRCRKQTKLFRALVKYGYDNFEKIILEECPEDQKILDDREDYWIRHYDSVENGYNCRYGGSNGKMCEETKTKMKALASTPSRRMLMSKTTKSYIDANGHNWKNKTHREESKLKIASHDRSGKKCPSHGKIWINNGIESRKIPKDDPIPEGFIRKRLMNTVWVNNGIERKFISKDAPLPDGFVYGKLYRRKNRLCK